MSQSLQPNETLDVGQETRPLSQRGGINGVETINVILPVTLTWGQVALRSEIDGICGRINDSRAGDAVSTRAPTRSLANGPNLVGQPIGPLVTAGRT
jgi:hypothetical protein